MIIGKRFLCVLSVVGVVVVGAVAGTAIFADPFSIPTSSLVVQGEINLAGKSAEFVARDGTMLSVQDSSSGAWYAFVPIIDRSLGKVNFAAYTITPRPEGGERLVEVSGTDIQVGSAGTLSLPGESVQVAVTSVRSGKFSRVALTDLESLDPADLQRSYGAIGGGLCALSCGDFSVGANSVSVRDCGVCQGEGATFR
jgi:hypothetical protein